MAFFERNNISSLGHFSCIDILQYTLKKVDGWPILYVEISTSHHDGDDFGFSACVSYTSGMWVSYGPYMTRIGRWLNPSIMSC